MRISIHNLFWFTVTAIWRGIPPWRWHWAWDIVAEGHRQEVHKAIWEPFYILAIWKDIK